MCLVQYRCSVQRYISEILSMSLWKPRKLQQGSTSKYLSPSRQKPLFHAARKQELIWQVRHLSSKTWVFKLSPLKPASSRKCVFISRSFHISFSPTYFIPWHSTHSLLLPTCLEAKCNGYDRVLTTEKWTKTCYRDSGNFRAISSKAVVSFGCHTLHFLTAANHGVRTQGGHLGNRWIRDNCGDAADLQDFLCHNNMRSCLFQPLVCMFSAMWRQTHSNNMEASPMGPDTHSVKETTGIWGKSLGVRGSVFVL